MPCVKEVGKVLKSGVDSAARTNVGQKLLGMGDRLLTVMDECLQWSLPLSEKTEEKNGEPAARKPELKRPLPWIVFLPTLLVLRFTRLALNFGTFILGMESYEPAHMVLMIRSAQKQLNESRSKALKESRSQKATIDQDRRQLLREASKSLAKSLRLTLSTLSCLDSGLKQSPSPPPIQIRVTSMFDNELKLSDGKDTLDTTAVAEAGKDNEKHKRKDGTSSSSEESDSLEGDENLEAKLQQFAEESSEDDPDFVLQNSDSQTDEEDENSDSGDSITETEIKDIVKDQADLMGPNENLDPRHKLSTNLDDEARYDVDVKGLPMAVALHNYEMRILKQKNNQKLVPIEETEGPEAQAEDLRPPTNGVGEEGEAAYYSPVSWKSVSPEIFMPTYNQVDFLEHEKKIEELNNGRVVGKKIEKTDV